MKNLFVFSWVCLLFLSGCGQSEPLDDVTKFETNKKGDYLLFHFPSPYEKEGYIKTIDNRGEVVEKYSIRDQYFAPSNVYNYSNDFYFTSGGYAPEAKLLKYNPAKRKMALIDTKQNEFIETFYKDSESEYVTTLMDKSMKNKVCDIKLNECINFKEEFLAQSVTTLDNYVFVAGSTSSMDKESIGKVKKFNRNLEFLGEITLKQVPNYFSYTSSNQKLYLFMYNGDIVEIDSNLDVKSYPMELSDFGESISEIKYNKNVQIDKDTIMVDMELHGINQKTHILATVSFENNGPVMKVIQTGVNEDVLNVDYESKEVFTRSYINGKTVISIRDTDSLNLKNNITLSNDDAIYYVDNIK